MKRKKRHSDDESTNDPNQLNADKPTVEPERLLAKFKEQIGNNELSVITKTVTTSIINSWASSKEVLDRVNEAVIWVSDLKARGSLFANWLILFLLKQQEDLPLLKDTFYTDTFAAVTCNSHGYPRRSKFCDQFQVFKQSVHATQLPWQDGNSQILCHARNEMVTVATTKLVNGFNNNRAAIMRWKIVDGIGEYLLELPLERLLVVTPIGII